MRYYQMTVLDLVEAGPVVPKKSINYIKGIETYTCPICDAPVGLYSIGTVHEEGWMLKKAACCNGHEIKWEDHK